MITAPDTQAHTAMSIDPQLRLLQFADGLFPAGGYAQSFGLETYVHYGRIRGRAGLEEFLRGYLECAAGPCDAVVVVAAGRRARGEDLERVRVLDAELDAMRPVAELREASRQMGRQTLRVASALIDSSLLAAFAEQVEVGLAYGHHPVVFGLIGGVLGWPAAAAARAYLQASATTIVQAALRLMAMGQFDGQRTLWAMGETISRLAIEAAEKDESDLWSFTPSLEIASMEHARLDARLFRS
jgi:urease accessory protein